MLSAMREHPWNIRRPSTEDYRRFDHLSDLHLLTVAWLKELEKKQMRAPHELRRIVSPGIQGILERLETLAETSIAEQLDSILDESYPGELLSKLSENIWTVQAWTLHQIQEKIKKSERDLLQNILEQSSWRAGRISAEKRWPNLHSTSRGDIRGIYSCLQNTPFSGYPITRAFLPIRVLSERAEIELLQCPHQIHHPEVDRVKDSLCELHIFWLRGFAYALNPQVTIDDTPGTDGNRCRILLGFLQH